MKRIIRQLISVFFTLSALTTLAMPMVSHFFDPGVFSTGLSENRKLAVFPDLRFSTLETYPDQLDKYFRDNFPFRDLIIKKSNLIRTLWLKLPSEHVLVGSGSWLFYKGNDIFDDLMGKRSFTEPELHEWFSQYDKKQKWLEQQGVGYLLVSIPNKSTIHKDKLPWWLQANLGESRFQQIRRRSQSEGKDYHIDLTDEIVELNKSGAQTYWPNDTHWSGNALLLGLTRIIEESRRFVPNLEVEAISSAATTTIRRIPGDLTGLIGLKDAWPLSDRITLEIAPPVTMQLSTSEISKMEPFFSLPDDHYSKPRIFENTAGFGTALVFHDSFLNTAISHKREGRNPIALPFRRTITIWKRPTLEKLQRIIHIEKPDLVIEERVERLLYDGNSK